MTGEESKLPGPKQIGCESCNKARWIKPNDFQKLIPGFWCEQLKGTGCASIETAQILPMRQGRRKILPACVSSSVSVPVQSKGNVSDDFCSYDSTKLLELADLPSREELLSKLYSFSVIRRLVLNRLKPKG